MTFIGRVNVLLFLAVIVSAVGLYLVLGDRAGLPPLGELDYWRCRCPRQRGSLPFRS